MASLTFKTVNGKRYWQLITSRRVNGQPRQVVLAHLGSADRLLQRLTQNKRRPLHAKVYDFGLVGACWSLAQDLGVIEIIDRHVPKRDQGLSVGQYLLLAAINRVVSPKSKVQMGPWYRTTALRRLVPTPQRQLKSQRFWDHMDALDENACRAIERDLSARLVERFKIDLRCLCFDCTNFDTFIDSTTPADLAQRGHAKSKRTDLRVVGLALLASTDFHIPLFSQVYPGNQPDAVTFAQVIPELEARYLNLSPLGDPLTLVFDKGNNSEDTFLNMAESPYRLLGSLVPSQHPELLEIPSNRFISFTDPRLPGVSAHRTCQTLWKRDWTVVVTRSQELLEGQLRGIAQHLHKRRQDFRSLQHRLELSQKPHSKGKGYTPESLQAHIERLTQGQYLRDILRADLHSRRGKLTLSYRTDQAALQKLKETTLGKRILFTDNHAWSTEDIILGYRSQYHVEAAFRRMKNPYHVGWDPRFHWTDQKIRVHALYCVLALVLSALLHRTVVQSGLAVSLDRLFDELSAIKEVVTLDTTASKGRHPVAQTTLTRLNPLQKRLATALNLEPFRPR
jgi:transposase